MTRQFLAAIGVLAWISQSSLWAGGPPQVQLRWTELGNRLDHRKIALTLPEGTQIRGNVLAVEPAGLRLKVTKTSNRKVMRKGERLIPRQSVSVLQVTEYGIKGRLIATLGTLGVASAVLAANYPDPYETPAVAAARGVSVVGVAGLGVASYFVGKRIDRHVTEIRIVAEP